MTPARGAVVLVAFPNSDLQTVKKRPALVIQDHEVPTDLPQVVLVLITSNLRREGPTRVPVKQDSKAGGAMKLLADSVILCDVMQTVRLDAILRIIGTCPMMDEVDAALRATLRLLDSPNRTTPSPSRCDIM